MKGNYMENRNSPKMAITDAPVRSVIGDAFEGLEKNVAELNERIGGLEARIRTVCSQGPEEVKKDGPGEPCTGIALADRVEAISRRVGLLCEVVESLRERVAL